MGRDDQRRGVDQIDEPDPQRPGSSHTRPIGR
jgi:hypothetical protein